MLRERGAGAYNVGIGGPRKYPLDTGGLTLEAYCLKCRDHRKVKDAQVVTLKNGRPATRGKCTVCGRAVFRIGKA